MTVQYQESGIGGEISVFSRMEGGAEGNLLEMSKQPIASTVTCMYVAGGYSKGGGGEQIPPSP